LNYYNYFTEIEDTFIRRRGKNLLLSPIDWAMMETWQERGIPLHIVLRGIESVFDHFDKNPRPRTIKGLLFCREEIEAQFAEWTVSQIGKSDTPSASSEDNPLSLSAIAEHIAGIIDKLRQVSVESLSEDIERAIARLKELKTNIAADPEQIDKSLSDIENFLDHALLSNLDKEHLKQIEKEIAGQMRAYKADMEKEAYDTTFRLMLLKRLREDLGIPRMSLFYL
jgi:hypothetical protein